MLQLLGDTCVWLDLAKNVNGEPLIAACRQLIEEERLELLVPQIVMDEFERNRGRIETDMARSRARPSTAYVPPLTSTAEATAATKPLSSLAT